MAPPYDVITPDDQRRYYAQDPRNVVRLIAGEVKPTDQPGDNKYSRAAAFFQEWLAEGILRREPGPCLFAYQQTFALPRSGEVRSRTGLLCLVELEPFGRGVLAHERTHARPKADRLSLTQAVEANLSPVFSLYEDPSGAIRRMVRSSESGNPRFTITTDGQEIHRVWCVGDEAQWRALAGALASSRLFIADGHHRYETALNFRDKQRLAHPEAPADAAFNYVLMLLVAAEDPGLVILPTHRALRDLDGFNPNDLLARLRARYRLRHMEGRASLLEALDEPSAGHRIGIATAAGLATLDIPRLRPGSNPVDALDVTVLHREILERELDLHEGVLENELHLTYSRDANLLLDRVAKGHAQAAFLLRPPGVRDVLAVARTGQVMPQKSTYFYPKPLSGIVFNPLRADIRIPNV